jgi:hypothetical protein
MNSKHKKNDWYCEESRLTRGYTCKARIMPEVEIQGDPGFEMESIDYYKIRISNIPDKLLKQNITDDMYIYAIDNRMPHWYGNYAISFDDDTKYKFIFQYHDYPKTLFSNNANIFEDNKNLGLESIIINESDRICLFYYDIKNDKIRTHSRIITPTIHPTTAPKIQTITYEFDFTRMSI